MDDRKCPLCAGAMEVGFIVDQAHGSTSQEQWIKGEPEPSFWTGIKIRGTTRYKVTTFRCAVCGYLQSFAIEAIG